MRPLLVAALILAPTGCGYRFLDPAAGGGRPVAVPPAANQSRWRGLEADFTAALRADLGRLLDLRLVDDAEDPDRLILRTELEEPRRGAPVRGEDGGALVGSSQIQVRWSLADASGRVLGRGRLRRTYDFLPGAGEDSRRAMLEILDSMAESVVLEVGARLDRAAPAAIE